MKKTAERKYFDKEWSGMRASMKSFLKEGQQEDLHQFRLQIKKLRAFLILSDSEAHNPKLIKHFKLVKRIFNEAGVIRDAYINLELGKAYQIKTPGFEKNQQQQLATAIKRFNLRYDKHVAKIKYTYKKLKREIKPISEEPINLFYQNQLQQISTILGEQKFNKQLHDCRKQLKILIFNHKLFQPELHIGFNKDYLGQVQTAIGDWHDIVLAKALFSSKTEKDKEVIVNLKKQDLKNKKYITDLTKDFYRQATTVEEVLTVELS
ncbi:CHAD domain-containing protein [Pedobacter sp. CG_S7]|uniref:CHAD domain-containing protein n=1 Tax=Pedobacter sp. CG_S7 TaxID=3143930 RepID=UPI0033952105